MRCSIVLCLALGALVITGCAEASDANTELPTIPTAIPAEVDWETAVDILNTGQVAMVAQFHNLEVILTLKNGSEVRTVEPVIDAIFEEVEKCGTPCGDILLATE